MKTAINLMALGLGVVMLSGCATAPAYRVEDRRIVLGSPFALEIGSTEYAKTFGDKIRTSAHAYYDPRTKTTTTNYYHSAEASLAEPYFGMKRVWMSFGGDDKALERFCFTRGEYYSGNERDKMTYAECRKQVDEIVKDIERRFGIDMTCTNDQSEEAAKKRVQELVGEIKREGRRSGGCAISFCSFRGERKCRFASVACSVSGMYDNNGGYNVDVSCERFRDIDWPSFRPGDKIPVYTNEMVSAASGSLVPTEEQKAAHEEAKKLRETIKRLFDVDLDRPSETYDLLSVASLTNAEKDVKREWTAMEKPFEGLAERKVNVSVRLFAIPFGTCALRCPYEGDVSAAELEAQAKRILTGLERELGAKIPEADTKDGVEMLAKRFGEGVPTYGDTKALLGLDKKTHFTGKVGDLAVEIGSAEPRYVKKGDKYEITCKGAVVVNFVQSPLVTKRPR